jgi:uncharacterized protein (DUF2062 family)
MRTYFHKIKNLFLQLFTLNDTPRRIAGGAALGIFLGILPGEGLGTTLVVASFLKLNRSSASIGVLATNMWTTFVMLPLVTVVGSMLFHQDPNYLTNQFFQTYHLGWKYFLSKAIFFDLALPIFTGYLIVAAIISLISYLVFYFLITRFKNIRR